MTAFIWWLSLFPFILLYGAYEGPKVFWLWIGGFFLSVWWIIQIVRSRTIHVPQSFIWFSLWIIVASLASFLGIHPWDSVLGGSYRHQGILFFVSLLLIWLTIFAAPEKWRQKLSSLIAWGAVGETLVIFWQSATNGYVRPLGTLGEPNAVAGYLALSIFWVNHLNVKLVIRIIAIACICAAIIVTGSRTGIATATLVLIGMGCGRANISKNLKRHGKQSIGIIFIAVVALGLLMWKIGISKPASIYEDRNLFWRLGIEKFINRPILGYGLESGEVLYDQAFRSINVKLGDFMVDRSHNVFLDVALWSGIIGLIIFVGWVTSSAKDMIARGEYGRAIVLAAWILFACFQPIGVVHWLQLIFLLSWV